ncbi:hypothetical protein HJFPF1_07644 [Paramyrothecium foliicola]|nr:hypothetical protein HJFPF1_07644 [Paramyrothecium foliicola]
MANVNNNEDGNVGSAAARPQQHPRARVQQPSARVAHRKQATTATFVQELKMDAIVDSATGVVVASKMYERDLQENVWAPSTRLGLNGIEFCVDYRALPDVLRHFETFGKGRKVICLLVAADDAKFEQLRDQEGTELWENFPASTTQCLPAQANVGAADTAGFGDDAEDYEIDEDSDEEEEAPLTDEQRREREEAARRYREERARKLEREFADKIRRGCVPPTIARNFIASRPWAMDDRMEQEQPRASTYQELPDAPVKQEADEIAVADMMGATAQGHTEDAMKDETN